MRCLAALLVLPVLGCGDPTGEGTLLLGWTFVDGRRCAESGAERVVLTRPGRYEVLAESDCPAGFGVATLEIVLPAGDQELQLTALSGSESPLYRGTFGLSLSPGTTVDRVVELAFVGGF